MKKPGLLMLLMLAVIAGCASSLQKQSEDITVTYEAITRGSNMIITAKQDAVTTNTVRSEKISATSTISQEQWKEVINEIEKVDLDKISELEAPTNKRLYDGALIASVIIQLKDTTYRSSSFDHGNPPAEIVSLVNKIIHLSGVEKSKE
jgi:hypothetical protein